MIKNEIKSGMIVKLRNGKKFMVIDNPKIENSPFLMSNEDFLSLNYYNNDLTYKFERDKDIILVYLPRSARRFPDILNDDSNLYKIWEFKDKVKISKKDIKKKFGLREDSELEIL